MDSWMGQKNKSPFKDCFALKFWVINFKATTTKSYTLFSEKVMNSKHCKMNKIVFVISIKT